MPVEITEYIGPSKPVRMEDSLRYACMDKGFSTRGVPPGLTKREAYCAICTAPHCIYHPEMTPKMVMRRVKTRYPEVSMAWALYGERGHIHREMVAKELAQEEENRATRNRAMKLMKKQGETLQEIGDTYGLSRQRIGQIVGTEGGNNSLE